MTIQSASLSVGGSISVSGGTATGIDVRSYSTDRTDAKIGTSASLAMQKKLVFTTKPARVSVNAPGGYTQARSEVVVAYPITLENGNVTICTARVQLSMDPAMPSADLTALRSLAAQVMTDSDFDGFWTSQALV